MRCRKLGWGEDLEETESAHNTGVELEDERKGVISPNERGDVSREPSQTPSLLYASANRIDSSNA